MGEHETIEQRVEAEDPGYALSASSEHEHKRLRRQAERFAPFTHRLLKRAGIKPGMRVLDVGCGPGDVSFLVSELVGCDGSVIAIERERPKPRPRTSSSSTVTSVTSSSTVARSTCMGLGRLRSAGRRA